MVQTSYIMVQTSFLICAPFPQILVDKEKIQLVQKFTT